MYNKRWVASKILKIFIQPAYEKRRLIVTIVWGIRKKDRRCRFTICPILMKTIIYWQLIMKQAIYHLDLINVFYITKSSNHLSLHHSHPMTSSYRWNTPVSAALTWLNALVISIQKGQSRSSLDYQIGGFSHCCTSRQRCYQF